MAADAQPSPGTRGASVLLGQFTRQCQMLARLPIPQTVSVGGVRPWLLLASTAPPAAELVNDGCPARIACLRAPPIINSSPADLLLPDCRELQDDGGVKTCLQQLCAIFTNLEDYLRVSDYVNQLRDMAQSEHDADSEVQALTMSARCHLNLGSLQAAESTYKAALRICQEHAQSEQLLVRVFLQPVCRRLGRRRICMCLDIACQFLRWACNWEFHWVSGTRGRMPRQLGEGLPAARPACRGQERAGAGDPAEEEAGQGHAPRRRRRLRQGWCPLPGAPFGRALAARPAIDAPSAPLARSSVPLTCLLLHLSLARALQSIKRKIFSLR